LRREEDGSVSAWFGISGVAIVLLGAVMLVLEGKARR
jgi:DHA3 family macrolide efflux protein-like MFS transporter